MVRSPWKIDEDDSCNRFPHFAWLVPGPEDAIKVIGSNGKQYSTSTDALLAFPDQTFILEEIQPDVTKSATLVYDLPKSAVSGAKLQVEDLFSDAKGRIRLGL